MLGGGSDGVRGQARPVEKVPYIWVNTNEHVGQIGVYAR